MSRLKPRFGLINRVVQLKKYHSTDGINSSYIALTIKYLRLLLKRVCRIPKPIEDECVRLDNSRGGYSTASDVFSTTSGVPQEFILGPIIFALFVLPLGDIISKNGASCHQYADDTQLYMTLSPGAGCFGRLSDCAKEVEKWFLLNGLLLNPSKTEKIVFGTQQNFAISITLLDLISLGW